MKIVTNVEACYGCKVCELICSFHHKGVFSPDSSSIKVWKNNRTAEVELSIDSTCDLCGGHPLCVEYCQYEGALKEVK